jgi:hypothetical protein
VALLNWRTGDRAIGTEHATIALSGLQPSTTTLAVIEELASIGRHRFDGLVVALGAGQGRFKLHPRLVIQNRPLPKSLASVPTDEQPAGR